MLEYTETSVGAYDKNLIKDDLYTSNTPVNGALVQKHSENAWRSLKNNLEVVTHNRESAHTYVYAWLGEEEKHPNGTKLKRELKWFLQLLLISLSTVHRSEEDAACMQRALLPMCSNTLGGKKALLIGTHSRSVKTRLLHPPGGLPDQKEEIEAGPKSQQNSHGIRRRFFLWWVWPVTVKSNFEINWYMNFTNTLLSQKTVFSTNGFLLPQFTVFKFLENEAFSTFST